MENSNHEISTDKNETYELDRMNIAEIVAENERRNAALKVEYDPIAGVGCCKPRVPYAMKNEDGTPDKSATPKNNSCQKNILKLAANSIEYLMSN